jgi:polysaccharide export outer membrane protein
MNTSITKKILLVLVYAFFIGVQTGCQAYRESQMETDIETVQPDNISIAQAQRPKRNTERPGVFLEPGDVLEIKFFYTPELDVTQTIRPDGRISLQLIGDIIAEGKTPEQLRSELWSLYKPRLKDPEITILIKSLYARRVFVAGQVTKPGPIEMPGDITLMEAIMEAGGFDLEHAELENIVVIRNENQKRRGYVFNLKPTLEGQTPEPFFLKPRDIVYVPQTRITEVDQWIDQHINKMIPRLPFYFTYPIGGG